MWLFGTEPYGKKRVMWPGWVESKPVNVHRYAYQLLHYQENLPRQIDGVEMEVSHLCHEPRCIRRDHLVFEPKDVNRERDHCKNQNLCTHNHFPFCIFHYAPY